jgi:hypothetical protein
MKYDTVDKRPVKIVPAYVARVTDRDGKTPTIRVNDVPARRPL